MQSEEFDNKARQAAEHHHPAYDEKAWERMEKLLNKHLPQKKDDRRRIAFILLFIGLLGAGGFLMISKPWQTSRPVATTGNKAQPTLPGTPTAGNDQEDAGKPTPKNARNNDRSSLNNKMLIAKEKNETGIPGRNNPAMSISAKKTLATSKLQEKTDLITVQKNDPIAIPSRAGLADPVKDKAVVEGNKAEKNLRQLAEDGVVQSPEKNVDKKDNTEPVLKKDSKTNAMQRVPELAPLVGKKNRVSKKKSNSFFLTLSTGPEVSSVGDEKLGKMKLMVGAGVGYTFRNRFTVRTGLYSSRKIYTASPYEYHPPDYFWQFYPDLQEVDADCKVMEIPLSLSYNFSSSTRQSWFGTAGFSSYLMKRETYDYRYKNSSGQLLDWKATLHNRSKHYFSVLTLSGGYQRRINNTFSVMAEPFLKIPMIGVGYGKVKLSSAGVLFSLGIHPFHSKKTKQATAFQLR